MGRTFSEHPFHEQQPMMDVQGSGPRLGTDEDKQKLRQQRTALTDMPAGYRQPHAETIQRYQRRRARKLAGEDAPGGGRAAARKAPAAKKAPVAGKAPVAKRAKAVTKSTGRTGEAPVRGGKTLERVAAAAKTAVRRVAKKASTRKAPKKR